MEEACQTVSFLHGTAGKGLELCLPGQMWQKHSKGKHYSACLMARSRECTLLQCQTGNHFFVEHIDPVTGP
jgi:hypothetical protein